MDNIKYFREQALETIARNIIKTYNPQLLGSNPSAIPIEEIIERQADILAQHLLMPTGQVKMAFYRVRGKSANPTNVLAQLFEVSNKAMEIKLKSCGLI